MFFKRKEVNMREIIRMIVYGFFIKLSELIFIPRTEVRGMDNLPKEGGFIVAANHISVLDPFVLIGVMKKFLWKYYASMGKRIYGIGNAKLLDGSFFAFFLKENFGFIPNTHDGSLRAVELLNKGNIVGITPEGGVNLKDYIVKGKTGVAYIALLSGAPLIPVAFIGQPAVTFSQWIKTLFNPKKLIFGSPMDFSKKNFLYPELDSELATRVTNKIMCRIAELAGKEYREDIKHISYKKQRKKPG